MKQVRHDNEYVYTLSLETIQEDDELERLDNSKGTELVDNSKPVNLDAIDVVLNSDSESDDDSVGAGQEGPRELRDSAIQNRTSYASDASFAPLNGGPNGSALLFNNHLKKASVESD